ncbi:MAG TPA: DoxX family protein [Gemmatimonadaceae bacterium]
MDSAHVSNIVLWSVQGFLALFFLGAGAPKLIGRGLERWTGFSDLSRPLVIVIGLTEFLGAAGLVLPMATGVLPWLTPLAALGLAIIVLMASGFHLRADERLEALETTLWASIATGIAIGRWHLVAARVEIAPWMLVAALAVLLPAAVTNVIVLVRRPVRGGAPQPAPGALPAHESRGRAPRGSSTVTSPGIPGGRS